MRINKDGSITYAVRDRVVVRVEDGQFPATILYPPDATVKVRLDDGREFELPLKGIVKQADNRPHDDYVGAIKHVEDI